MSNLTVKQKIILGIVILAMLIVIGIYGYISLNSKEDTVDLGLDESNNIEEENKENIGENIEENIEELENDKVENEDIHNQENTAILSQEGKIVIHIIGSVQKTGILVLPEGARIADAIDAANGITEEADLDKVNLAYVLQDGQKIYIPSKSDKLGEGENNTYITSNAGHNVIIEGETSSNQTSINKVNINTATQSELETLPGIGASTASKILEYRQQHGKFNQIEELQNVSGIGEAKLANIKEYVVVK